MGTCIFCNGKSEHAIGAKGKGICLDCLIQLKKIEYQHSGEVMKKVLPLNLKKLLQQAKSVTGQISTTDVPPAQQDLIRKAKVVMKTLKI